MGEPSQKDRTVRAVELACGNVTKLLHALEKDIADSDAWQAELKAAGYRGGGPRQTSNGRSDDVGADPTFEAIDDVGAMRTLAADDASLEIASVADYSSEPPGAPVFGDRCLSESIEGIQQGLAKSAESVATMQHCLANSSAWWSAPITMRRLKAHAVRINYHARKVRKWAHQGRSHLFVSSSVLNRNTRDAATELKDLHLQQLASKERKSVAVAARDEGQQRLEELHDEVATLMQLHELLDKCCVRRATELAQSGTLQPSTLEGSVDAAQTSQPFSSVSAELLLNLLLLDQHGEIGACATRVKDLCLQRWI